jgi:cytosine/adenosine deaminase-related metal-dependent hydrolase
MAVLLKNATFVDWRTLEFQKANILTGQEEGRFQFIKENELPEGGSGLEVIDCTGKIVTKSFAIGHHHAYSVLSCGMGAPQKVPANFIDTLTYVWWTLDRGLDLEMIEYSALATAISCARSGSTFIIDHHSSPNAINGSLETIARAFDLVGISHLLCYEISDRDGTGKAFEGLMETESYLMHRQGLVGLHASFTIGKETLKRAALLMIKHETGAHIHVAEDLHDEDDCIRKYGKRVVERLDTYGIPGSPKTILAHCLHLNTEEAELVSKSPCWVVQNAESNFNNNVGRFNGKLLGKRIMTGTDGMNSDMFQSSRAAYLSGRGSDSISPDAAYERLRNVNRYLQENKYTGDGEDNLIILDYEPPTEINRSNFTSHFIFGMNSSHVQHVISKGKLIVRDRKILTVDEPEIMKEAKRCANMLWKKMQA